MVTIGSGFLSYYYAVADELIDTQGVGEACRLYFVSKTNCPNCLKGAPGKYRPGGPIEFSIGMCPYCNGKNYVENVTNRDVNLRTYWREQDWRKIAKIEFREGRVMVIGYMRDYDDFRKATHMRFFTDLDQEYKYKLTGEPMPHGFGKRYFAAVCDRI